MYAIKYYNNELNMYVTLTVPWELGSGKISPPTIKFWSDPLKRDLIFVYQGAIND